MMSDASRSRREEVMAKKEELKTGDRVEWNTSQGKTTGRVRDKVTGRSRVKGHDAKASKDEPQIRVKSDKSGKEAIHKPESLRKKR